MKHSHEDAEDLLQRMIDAAKKVISRANLEDGVILEAAIEDMKEVIEEAEG